VQEPCGPFDVGEEKSDCSGRKVRPPHGLSVRPTT
jgi:hypothetical protein